MNEPNLLLINSKSSYMSSAIAKARFSKGAIAPADIALRHRSRASNPSPSAVYLKAFYLKKVVKIF